MTATQRTSMIDSNQAQLNSDYDFSMLWKWLLGTGGGILKSTDFTFVIGTGVLSAVSDIAEAIIPCTRLTSNPLPNQTFLAHFQFSGSVTLPTANGTKIYIEITESLINNPTLIEDEAGSTTFAKGFGIGEIKGTPDRPSHSNYIPLYSISGGVATDLREVIAIGTVPLNGTNRSIPYMDGDGKLKWVALGSASQVLNSSGTSSAPTFTSPTVDIVGLTEDTNPDVAADYGMTRDVSASLNKKVLLQNRPVGINNRTEDTSPAIGDFFLEWDVSASALKKVSLANLINNGYVMDIVQLTKSTADASGSLAISHNLGRLPKMILSYMIPSNYTSYDCNSWGFWTPSEEGMLNKGYNGSIKSGYGSSVSVRAELHASTSVHRFDGSIGSPTTTQVTMTWTKTGTPITVTMEILLLFIG